MILPSRCEASEFKSSCGKQSVKAWLVGTTPSAQPQLDPPGEPLQQIRRGAVGPLPAAYAVVPASREEHSPSGAKAVLLHRSLDADTRLLIAQAGPSESPVDRRGLLELALTELASPAAEAFEDGDDAPIDVALDAGVAGLRHGKQRALGVVGAEPEARDAVLEQAALLAARDERLVERRQPDIPDEALDGFVPLGHSIPLNRAILRQRGAAGHPHRFQTGRTTTRAGAMRFSETPMTRAWALALLSDRTFFWRRSRMTIAAVVAMSELSRILKRIHPASTTGCAPA